MMEGTAELPHTSKADEDRHEPMTQVFWAADGVLLRPHGSSPPVQVLMEMH